MGRPGYDREALGCLLVVEPFDLLEILSDAFERRNAPSEIELHGFSRTAFENRGQNLISDPEVSGPVESETLANLYFSRNTRLFQILPDAVGDAAVSFARLVGVFDLKIAVVCRQGVERAAASLLSLVLQFSNPAQPKHRSRIHSLRFDVSGTEIAYDENAHANFDAEN